ncbi:hypothetical protein AC578_8092 [Pseudocercospora eumusae]|uniref:Uncharacterized protein n=1 Tax=Pseudocercospora eumusae TaxID=321146 RepID=A0A139H0N8_9PEZI|nr:hypothetical protein AC578_8092 [Pseudocercospora eumusae]
MEKKLQLDSTEEMFHSFVALRSASYSNNGKEADVEVGRMTGEYTPSAYSDSVNAAKPSLSPSRSQVASTVRSSHVTRPQMAYLGQFQFEHRNPDECGICH